jgi:hypothetical protein
MADLQHAASRRLEACMAGSDPKNIWQVPDTTGVKHEVIMEGGRRAFDNAIRLTGATLASAAPEDLRALKGQGGRCTCVNVS